MDDYIVRNHCGLITVTNYSYSVAGDRECEVNLVNLTKSNSLIVELLKTV